MEKIDIPDNPPVQPDEPNGRIDCLAVHDEALCTARAGCVWDPDQTFPYTGTCLCDKTRNLKLNQDTEPVCICMEGYGRASYDRTLCVKCNDGEEAVYDPHAQEPIPCATCTGRGRKHNKDGHCVCNKDHFYKSADGEETLDKDCECTDNYLLNTDGVCIKQKTAWPIIAYLVIILTIIIITAINSIILVIRHKKAIKIEKRRAKFMQLL